MLPACRRMDCLALSYLEVLQARSLAELGVASMAAAVAAEILAYKTLEHDSEPQCDRLADLFMVPALQPLLLAYGGVEALLAGALLAGALLAGALRLLVSYGCDAYEPDE